MKLANLANKNNISQSELNKIKILNKFKLAILQKVAKQRNINITTLNKPDILLALLKSEKSKNEDEFIKQITNDTKNELLKSIYSIRKQLITVSPFLDETILNQIRKRLYDIQNSTNLNWTQRSRLSNELNSIKNELRFVLKNINAYFNFDAYANLQDIEYMFGEIDEYYKPI